MGALRERRLSIGLVLEARIQSATPSMKINVWQYRR
jgi:hypothetical protein